MQQVLFLPVMSFLCPIVLYPPGYGMERNCSLLQHPLLPAGISTSIFLDLSNLCRTLSASEAVFTVELFKRHIDVELGDRV